MFALRWDSGSKVRLLTEDLPQIGITAATIWKASPFVVGLKTFSLINQQPFKIACIKAEKTGKALAYFLTQRIFAGCSVSLLGFSLGTRVIYYCLKELSILAPGLIHNVYLMGGTVDSSASDWGDCRNAVAGRLVNVSSKSDYALKYFYRLAKFENPIGVNQIQVNGIENYDISDLVSGHSDYREKLDVILKKINF